MKNLYFRLNLMFVALFLAIMPFSAFAEDAAPAAGVLPEWLMALVAKVPVNTIAWVLAVVGLLNGLAVGLDKVVKLTATDSDDKLLAGLNKILASINSVLKFFIGKPQA